MCVALLVTYVCQHTAQRYPAPALFTIPNPAISGSGATLVDIITVPYRDSITGAKYRIYVMNVPSDADPLFTFIEMHLLIVRLLLLY